eukprot:GHRQ01012532.1.p1 GENE.GHRQ01012532.1~~GHRQ01012532.1.p1  ORF type:complete len:129 (+),score=36.30 GHRQ01012532.1:169-555(+)
MIGVQPVAVPAYLKAACRCCSGCVATGKAFLFVLIITLTCGPHAFPSNLCCVSRLRVACRGTMDVNPERKRDWGRRLEVFWEGDGVFYRGSVTGYSTSSGKHTIMYDDGDTERVKLDQVRAASGWFAV